MGSAADGPPSTGAGLEATPAPDAGEAAPDDIESKRISPIPQSDVIELFNTLEKTVRARRLYQDNNPVYQNFLRALHDIAARVFSLGASITVNVEEHGLRWYGQLIETGSGRDNLAFLFYKDGVRQLTFLDGFQDEIDGFLAVVHRARAADQQGDDDMVTLLWEEEFTCFQYSYVDALAEGLEVPQAPAAQARLEAAHQCAHASAPAADALAHRHHRPLLARVRRMRPGAPDVSDAIRRSRSASAAAISASLA